MKIYLAGERYATDEGIRAHVGEVAAAVWVKNVKRRLFSYYYHGFDTKRIGNKQSAAGLSKDVDDCRRLGMDLFLDSGAFTAFTKKKEIPIEDYAEYVNKTRSIWTVASSLDAIGRGEEAARKSYENFRALRGLGADVQPVWHVREPAHWLQRYIDEGEDYIFIGGMVPETTQWLMLRLDEVWTAILTNQDGSAKVKTHGFGLTDQQLMFRYPWHSVDSTSWLMTGVFGACVLRIGKTIRKVVFSESSPQARKFSGWHYERLPEESQRVIDGILEQYEVTAQQLSTHYSYRDIVNAAVFQGLEDLGATVFHNKQGVLFA